MSELYINTLKRNALLHVLNKMDTVAGADVSSGGSLEAEAITVSHRDSVNTSTTPDYTAQSVTSVNNATPLTSQIVRQQGIDIALKKYQHYYTQLMSLREPVKRLNNFVDDPPGNATIALAKVMKPLHARLDKAREALDVYDASTRDLQTQAESDLGDSTMTGENPSDGSAPGIQSDLKTSDNASTRTADNATVSTDKTSSISEPEQMDLDTTDRHKTTSTTTLTSTSIHPALLKDPSALLTRMNNDYAFLSKDVLPKLEELHKFIMSLQSGANASIRAELRYLRWEDEVDAWMEAFIKVWTSELGGVLTPSKA